MSSNKSLLPQDGSSINDTPTSDGSHRSNHGTDQVNSRDAPSMDRPTMLTSGNRLVDVESNASSSVNVFNRGNISSNNRSASGNYSICYISNCIYIILVFIPNVYADKDLFHYNQVGACRVAFGYEIIYMCHYRCIVYIYNVAFH